MPTINITVTAEELKAVEGIVPSAADWLQEAWSGKSNKCAERVIKAESNLNPAKLSKAEKDTWIKDNTFKTRAAKDAEIGNP